MTDIQPLEITSRPNMFKEGLDAVSKSISAVVILISEIAVVGIIGSLAGSYVTSKTIVADCQHVNIAKVSDSYIKCTVVEPVKDSATQPPR